MKIELPPYACDVCKKRRDSDANHWFVFRVVNERDLFVELWSDIAAGAPNAAHACGQAHAAVLFARWASVGTLSETA